MKFKTKEETKGDEVELWLEENREKGEVNLMGKDDEGLELMIMTFRDGGFCRIASANLYGIETDEEGRIKEE